MPELRTVTLEQVIAMRPCIGETKTRVYARIAGLTEGTALDVLRMGNVPAEHRIWTILHTEFLDDAIMWEFACWYAEDALQYVKERYGIEPDETSLKAIETRRKWLKGEATDEELRVAAHAAYDAAAGAAGAAAYDAAAGAAGAAGAASAYVYGAAATAAYGAAAAAYGAGAGAACEKRVEKLIKMLEE